MLSVRAPIVTGGERTLVGAVRHYRLEVVSAASWKVRRSELLPVEIPDRRAVLRRIHVSSRTPLTIPVCRIPRAPRARLRPAPAPLPAADVYGRRGCARKVERGDHSDRLAAGGDDNEMRERVLAHHLRRPLNTVAAQDGYDRCECNRAGGVLIELAAHDGAEQIGVGDDSPNTALLVVTDDDDRVNPMPCHEPSDVAQR